LNFVKDSVEELLTILREIRDGLPREDLIYVADSRYAPYGERAEAFIEQRVTTIVEYLIDQQAKAVVVACNTATGVAIDALRSRFRIPIVAIEPALKPAAAITRTGRVGVLATNRTLESEKFARLRERHGAGVEVVIQPCPGLAEQVEKGEFESAATRALIAAYVQPLVDKGVDTLVLGCTHYPFLQPLIRDAAGPGVTIVDPAAAIARELARQLEREQLRVIEGPAGTTRFVTSGAPDQVTTVIVQLWQERVTVERLPDRYAAADDQ
jgi:glutamate racemase